MWCDKSVNMFAKCLLEIQVRHGQLYAGVEHILFRAEPCRLCGKEFGDRCQPCLVALIGKVEVLVGVLQVGQSLRELFLRYLQFVVYLVYL